MSESTLVTTVKISGYTVTQADAITEARNKDPRETTDGAKTRSDTVREAMDIGLSVLSRKWGVVLADAA